MHACALLLEEAFSLLRQEEAALKREDLDTLEELASQRDKVLRQIWERREGFSEEQLRESLDSIYLIQKKLRKDAEALHAAYRVQQRNGRKQSRYFNGDRYIRSEIQKSFYCDKIS